MHATCARLQCVSRVADAVSEVVFAVRITGCPWSHHVGDAKLDPALAATAPGQKQITRGAAALPPPRSNVAPRHQDGCAFFGLNFLLQSNNTSGKTTTRATPVLPKAECT